MVKIGTKFKPAERKQRFEFSAALIVRDEAFNFKIEACRIRDSVLFSVSLMIMAMRSK